MDDARIAAFVARVVAEGDRLYRDFPWRRTADPYAILVSEVMLQQTQVGRVVDYFDRWMADFPTFQALAAAPLEAVLRRWQGLGYNRRAVALKRVAEVVAEQGALPREEARLVNLPGIGPATAAGIRAFAFGEPSAYLETNVRTVFLHELFADATEVRDSELLPLVRQAAEEAQRAGIDARTWNYALLDYGAHLKKVMPNPSRRSAQHTRQSPFEGSRRQLRARLLRTIMDAPGSTTEALAADLGAAPEQTQSLLEELSSEGFVSGDEFGWSIAS